MNSKGLKSYNFLAIMPGCVNYFFCIIEEVNFLSTVSPVLGTKYLQVVLGDFPLFISLLSYWIMTHHWSCWFFLFSLSFLCFSTQRPV